jgi:hypothetical protein
VDADTVARRTTATALVLDRSGSMADDGGDGRTKHALLQQAAGMFVDLVLDGDGVGVVRYDEDAQALQPVLPLGPGGLSDTNRTATHDLISGDALDPAGATSIGDGVAEGRALLRAAQGFDGTALVVLTDGIENSPRSIADAATGIDDRTYAVGLGQPHTISVPALQALSGNTGGYLLVTGAITGDARFRLQKHFLQILSGVSTAEVVLDPDGVLAPGAVHRIPFQLSDADSGVEVVLLTPRPDQVDFRLQTPNGLLLEPWRADADAGMRYLTGDGLVCYRVALPVQLRPGRFDQAGTWHAVLTIGEPRTERDPHDDDGVDLSVLRGRRAGVERSGTGRREFEFERAFAVAAAEGVAPTATRRQQRGLPYSLVVHAYSDVALRVRAGQQSFEPGAEVTVEATLTQAGLPAAGRVRAEVTRPHGTTAELVLGPVGPGEFVGRFIAEALGVHSVRVRARGRTRTGLPFTREHTATAAVWRGGDGPAPVPDPER